MYILQSVDVSGIFVNFKIIWALLYLYMLALSVVKVIFLTHVQSLPQLPLILCLKELMRNVFFKGVNEVKNQDF